MDFNPLQAVKINLPGTFIPEIQGREVIIVMERKNEIVLLKEVKLSLLEEDFEPLDITYPIDNPIVASDMGKLIEEAAFRLIERTENGCD